MKRVLFNLFICPECKSDALDVRMTGHQQNEVISGEVSCKTCGRAYKVKDGVPLFVTDEVAALVDNLRPDKVRRLAEESELAGVKAANIWYHNLVAESYENDLSTEGIFEEGKGSQKRLGGIVRILRDRTEGQLFLDVGCGTGNVMNQAQGSFSWVMGIDISLEMLSVAYSRGLPVLLGDAEKMPLKPGSVDAISCFSTLHHLFDHKPAIREFARVLKPGGYLYTDWDPNALFVGHPNPHRHSFLYNVTLSMYRRFRDLKAKLRHQSNMQNEDAYCDVVNLAEYHHHFSLGLDPYLLREDLLSTGFTNVQIIFHSNSDSLTLSNNTERRMRLFAGLISLLDFQFEYPSLDRSGMVFLILARKSC